MLPSAELMSPPIITDTVRLPDNGPFIHITTEKSRMANLFELVASAVGRNGDYARPWFNTRVDFQFGPVAKYLSFYEQLTSPIKIVAQPKELRRKNWGLDLPFAVIKANTNNNKITAIVDSQMIASEMPKIITGYNKLPLDTRVLLYKRILESAIKHLVLYPLTDTNEVATRLKMKDASGKFVNSLIVGMSYPIGMNLAIAATKAGNPEFANLISAITLIPVSFGIYSFLRNYAPHKKYLRLYENDISKIEEVNSIPTSNAISYQVETR